MTGTQLNTALSKLVDSFEEDNTDGLTDDLLQEAMENPDQRDEAIDDLINYIEHNREEI